SLLHLSRVCTARAPRVPPTAESPRSARSAQGDALECPPRGHPGGRGRGQPARRSPSPRESLPWSACREHVSCRGCKEDQAPSGATEFLEFPPGVFDLDPEIGRGQGQELLQALRRLRRPSQLLLDRGLVELRERIARVDREGALEVREGIVEPA